MKNADYQFLKVKMTMMNFNSDQVNLKEIHTQILDNQLSQTNNIIPNREIKRVQR